MILLICGIQKNNTDELAKLQQRHKGRKHTYGHQAGEGMSGMIQEIGIDIYRLLCIKQMTNENTLRNTENPTQYSAVI